MSASPQFCYPVKDLANSKVKLVPFDSLRHTPRFVEFGSDQETWAHMPMGPFSVEALRNPWLDVVFAGPDVLIYAILDLTKPPENDVDEGALAGMIGYLDTKPDDLSTEIGAVIVLPAFRGKHVASNAAGLMLQHAFTPASAGGMGMSRVVWQTASSNKVSAKLAESLGFRYEGTLKYHHRIADGKVRGKAGNGRPPPAGSGENDLWRDTVLLALCWDDWAAGAEEKVQALLDRSP